MPSQTKFGKFIASTTTAMYQLQPSEQVTEGAEHYFNLCDTATMLVFLYPEAVLVRLSNRQTSNVIVLTHCLV